MRSVLFMILVSVGFFSYSQTESTTFLKWASPGRSWKIPESRFGSIIVLDNQLDSAPISIRAINNKTFDKLRLDTPVNQSLARVVSEELNQALHGSDTLIIVLNECRFFSTKGQVRKSDDRLVKINSGSLLKINLTLYSKAADSPGSAPEYLGRLDRFFKPKNVAEIPELLKNACVASILILTQKRDPATYVTVSGLRDSVILADDDINEKPQPENFDSLMTGQSPFIKSLDLYGGRTRDSLCIFSCFQDLKRQRGIMKADSLVYDQELGIVKYLSSGKNRKLVDHCWGILYGHSFYVRFNQYYFFEIQLNRKSAAFRVPDYLSNMSDLHSMGFDWRVNLNRSLHHGNHGAPAMRTLSGTVATVGLHALTKPAPKPGSRVTLLNLSAYSPIYRACRIDPVSGDIIYDFGQPRF